MMVEISKTTDNEVGDGTTSTVVLAGSLLEKAEELITKNVHPTVVVEGFKKASQKAIESLREIATKVDPTDKAFLNKIAHTSMASKIVSANSQQLADIVVGSVLAVAEKSGDQYKVDVDNIKVEKKAGGSMHDTRFIHGIVRDKEIVHGGMPKGIENAKIAVINSALEIEKTEFDAKININSPDQMKMFLECCRAVRYAW